MNDQRQQILADEARFADGQYQPHARDLEVNPLMFAKYARPTHMWDWRQRSAALLGDLNGKRLLDLGCGMGEESVYFALLGAQVTAIDISEVGINILRRRIARHHLEGRVTALRMAADPTGFADQSFDLIHGLGILHHLGLEPGLAEVRRLLVPGGAGVFLEPMGNSRMVEAAKGWLLARGGRVEQTEHEQPIRLAELLELGRAFSRLEHHPYHLLYRVKRYLPAGLHQACKRLDHQVLRLLPPARHLAGAVVMRLVR